MEIYIYIYIWLPGEDSSASVVIARAPSSARNRTAARRPRAEVTKPPSARPRVIPFKMKASEVKEVCGVSKPRLHQKQG